MDWKKSLKPTKKKIIIAAICIIVIPIILAPIFDVFDLPGEHTVLFSAGVWIKPAQMYGGIRCTSTPGGIDWACFAIKTAYWWIVNLVVYYLLISLIIYSSKTD